MCSVNGMFLTKKLKDRFQAEELGRLMTYIKDQSAERGSDSCGYERFFWEKEERGPGGRIKHYSGRHPGHPKELNFTIGVEDQCLLQHNRAEPASEFVAKKTEKDCQPFNYNGVYVSHNGTIANDDEILKGVERSTKIDSLAIAYALWHDAETRSKKFDQIGRASCRERV